MKIYTRTGDSGETSLVDGTRVPKSDMRVDAYGDVDELNAWLGIVRASGADAEITDLLAAIQRDLHAVGAQLADPAHRVAERVARAALGEDHVRRLEDAIDRFESELAPLRRFILPGGAPAGAALHVARTICRRAERRIVALTASAPDAAEPIVIVYVNRLSDLLFVLARAANRRANVAEAEWE